MTPQTYVLRTEETRGYYTRLHFTSQHTRTHTRIYVFGYFYWNS